MTASACKICGSKHTKKLFYSINQHGRFVLNKKDKFEVRQCLGCGLVYLSNVKINKRYYQKYYELGYYANPSISHNNRLDLFLRSLSNKSNRLKQNYILKYFSKRRRISLLDVGCGSGNFIYDLDKSKFNSYGIEVNPEGFSICKNKGLKVWNNDLLKIDFEGKKFDVVTLWQVLEHLDKPDLVIKKIREILKPNGLLVIQVPNSNSLGFLLGKRSWFHLDSPRHLYIFNKSGMNFLTRKYGFEIIKTKNEFYDYPLDLLWSVRFSAWKYLIYPFYIFCKIFDKEHVTFICRRSKNELWPRKKSMFYLSLLRYNSKKVKTSS